MKRLIAMVGLPRSGKGTWARAYYYLNRPPPPIVPPIVCPDSIRLALHGQRYIQEAEPIVWVVAKLMVRALFLAGHSTVILDSCNQTRKRRDEWQSEHWVTVFKEINTSSSECVKRAKAEGDRYIIPIIERMAAESEPLDDDERRL